MTQTEFHARAWKAANAKARELLAFSHAGPAPNIERHLTSNDADREGARVQRES